MSTRNSWTRHYQSVWEERAGDWRAPRWLRVACLAYGLHRANGHATLGAGMLALTLASPDPKTGEMVPDKNPGRAVELAVRYGWLAPGSNVRCLVVPAHAIVGPGGDPHLSCSHHPLDR
jgi:hypothetical protein